jgi:hypothetical protein
MDYVRERFSLPQNVSLYEAVVKVVSEFKQIEEKLQKSQKEKEDARRKKDSRSSGNRNG